MGYRVRHMAAEFYEHICDHCPDGDRRVNPPPAERTPVRVDRDRLRYCALTVDQLIEAARVLGFDLEVTLVPATRTDESTAPSEPPVRDGIIR